MAEANELVVVTAYRLADGYPVYLTSGGTWTPALQEAAVLSAEDGAAEAAKRGKTEQPIVADPYVFKVEKKDGFIDALSQRERIRSTGPTVRVRRPD